MPRLPSVDAVRSRRDRRGEAPSARPPRRVLVTGAASGLGAAFVSAYAAAGDQVLATDLHPAAADDQPSTSTLGSSAGALGSGAAAYRQLDVRREPDWAAAIDWVTQQWGGLDVLVNNAGVAAGGRFDRTPSSEWEWLLDSNLMGVVRGCQAVVPVFTAAGSGCIVNVASIAGLCHAPAMAPYNVAKAGVVALSETLAHELAPRGIQVSVVCPYFFRSNLADSLPNSDPVLAEAAVKAIRGARLSADQIAARALAGVDAGHEVVFTDAMGRAMYGLKQHARPVYRRLLGGLGRRLPMAR